MIGIDLGEHTNWEYDVRALVNSFCPGEETILGHEGAEWVIAVDDLLGADSDKSSFKKNLYRQLRDQTGRELPWGILTGIRPTKIAMGLLEEGMTKEMVAAAMREQYYVSPAKAQLAADIAERERKILAGVDYESGYSLYIGIPFCPTTCLYCSFTSYPMAKWEPRMDAYLDAVFREIDWTAAHFRGRQLDSIYIGGGTPTSLSAERLDRLLTKVEHSFDLSRLKEFTVEAGRPDSITEEKLRVIRDHAVTRMSVNPQSMRDKTLKLIGRHHSPEQVREAFGMARSLGIDNINMDIILGLPEELPSDVAYTIDEIEKMGPDSLTVHSLAIKRASRLKMEAEGVVTAGGTQQESEEMMSISAAGAERMGLAPYYLYRQKNMAGNLENVGFAAEGKAGIYNILIMEEKQSIVALGAGTVTKRVWADGRIERCDNVKDVQDYLDRIDEMIERKDILFR